MLNLIKVGDQNNGVKVLQTALGLKPSGTFDSSTLDAVKKWQSDNGLVADGVVGAKSIAALKLDLTPAKLDKQDYVDAAIRLKVLPAHIQTVAQVECSQNAFLASGDPTILFERHYFYKRAVVVRNQSQTEAGLTQARDNFAALNPDICNQKPGGYKGGAGEWERLNRAKVLSPEAAYESASWGMFQVMGAYWNTLDYPDVGSFVRAMFASEKDHLELFVRFLEADHRLIAAMQKEDWPTFARIYNGPNYATNKYDTKLATAFAKFSAQK